MHQAVVTLGIDGARLPEHRLRNIYTHGVESERAQEARGATGTASEIKRPLSTDVFADDPRQVLECEVVCARKVELRVRRGAHRIVVDVREIQASLSGPGGTTSY